jgi:tetratricopeptide (TPR) repeat protein
VKKAGKVKPPAVAPARRSRDWLWHAGSCLILLLMIGTVYRNSFQSEFVLDNQTVIQLDPRNKEATLDNLKLIWEKDYWWPTMYTRAYRPLVSTTYWLNWSVLGNGRHSRESDQVVGFHWVNLIAHGINAILVYFLMLRLLGRRTASFLIAALFAVHPIATESVTNIIGRTDEFMAMSILGGTLLYIRSTKATGLRRLPWLLGIMLIFAAGMLSKEGAIAFLAIPFVFDVIYRWGSEQYRDRRARRILADGLVYVMLAVPLLAVLYLRSIVFRAPLPLMPFLDNPILRFAWSDINSLSVNMQNWILARMTACGIAMKSLWKLIWPVHLSSDYSYSQIQLFSWQLSNVENLKAILGLFFIAGTVAVAAWCYRRHKAVSFLILFYWVAYGPTSNLLVESSSIMAERFLYVPSVAFCALMVIGAETLVQRLGLTAWPRLVPHGVFLAILILYGFRTYNRNFDWRSDITLAQSAMKESPQSFRGYFSLARAYFELDRIGRIDQVIELGETGLRMVDALPNTENSSVMYLHQGIYYGMKGETVATRTPQGLLMMNEKTQGWYEKSARVLERAAEIDLAIHEAAGTADLYMYLGMAYARLGREEKAVEAFTYMRHLGPRESQAYVSLGYNQFALGRAEDAVISFMQCVILSPERIDAWESLFEIYSEINREPIPAVEVTGGRHRLRQDNKLVQRHLVAAYKSLMKIAQASGQTDLLEEVRKSAVDVHGLSPAILDEALNERVVEPAPPSPVFHKLGQKFFD